jgi:hypothetical protein
MLLGNNQLVNILINEIESVDGEIIDLIDYSFATTFSPLYSTPNKIRAIVGSYIENISNEMLLYLIHIFSIEADMLAICKKEDSAKWSYYAGLWVANNVAVESIMNSNFYVNNAGQKVYKKLGDFSISKDNTSSDSFPAHVMLEKLKCEILKFSVSVKFCKEPLTTCDKSLFEQELRNGVASQLVVKGESLSKPMFGRVFHRDGRHPQMTGFIRILDKFRLTNVSPNHYDFENNGKYQFSSRY